MHIRHSTINEYKRRVCIAMNYISNNLDKDLSLEEIATAASFSSFHFHRIFKAVVGETVSEFTRRLRLENAACRLVISPDHDITRVALDNGFSSSQNFAKAFRRHFNVSPSEYRNSKNRHKDSNAVNALSLNSCYNISVFDKLNITERKNIMNAEIKEMPEYNVAYVRKLGEYGKELCEQGFNEIINWAGPKGYLMKGSLLAIYWDNPEITPKEKCRFDACVSVPEDITPDNSANIGMQRISGGSYAVCHFEVNVAEFKAAWNDAFKWLIENGYECANKPCYELYHNDPKDHPENKFIVDICIPLN